MTIKQYGGVFGRNPTFNEIDSDGNANLGDGALFVDSVNKRVGIDKTNPQYPLDFNTAATGMVARFGDDNVDSYVSFSNPRTFFGYHTGNTMVQSGAGKKIIFYTGSNTAGDAAAVAAEFTTSGNLAFPSGQGIDFSATAGTGTSELLDDYEEGAWTPVLSDAASGGNLATGTFDGIYTKVGNKVTVWLSASNINTSGMTGTSDLYIQDLPFASGSGASKSTGAVRSDSITFANYLVSIVSSSASTMLIYNIGSNVADTPLNVQDITSGSGDIFTSVTYFV